MRRDPKREALRLLTDSLHRPTPLERLGFPPDATPTVFEVRETARRIQDALRSLQREGIVEAGPLIATYAAVLNDALRELAARPAETRVPGHSADVPARFESGLGGLLSRLSARLPAKARLRLVALLVATLVGTVGTAFFVYRGNERRASYESSVLMREQARIGTAARSYLDVVNSVSDRLRYRNGRAGGDVAALVDRIVSDYFSPDVSLPQSLQGRKGGLKAAVGDWLLDVGLHQEARHPYFEHSLERLSLQDDGSYLMVVRRPVSGFEQRLRWRLVAGKPKVVRVEALGPGADVEAQASVSADAAADEVRQLYAFRDAISLQPGYAAAFRDMYLPTASFTIDGRQSELKDIPAAPGKALGLDSAARLATTIDRVVLYPESGERRKVVITANVTVRPSFATASSGGPLLAGTESWSWTEHGWKLRTSDFQYQGPPPPRLGSHRTLIAGDNAQNEPVETAPAPLKIDRFDYYFRKGHADGSGGYVPFDEDRLIVAWQVEGFQTVHLEWTNPQLGNQQLILRDRPGPGEERGSKDAHLLRTGVVGGEIYLVATSKDGTTVRKQGRKRGVPDQEGMDEAFDRIFQELTGDAPGPDKRRGY